MPHQCTNCEETFPDGSKEMLSGCPRCGGNTFQYLPSGSADAPAESPPEPPERPGPNNAVTETMGKAATTVRDYVSARSDDGPERPADGPPAGSASSSTPEREPTPQSQTSPDPPSEASADDTDDRRDAAVDTGPKSAEDTAQASARGEVADPSDLPDGPLSAGADPSGDESREPAPPRQDGRVVKEPDTDERPDLETLREELNDQFESIKILEPGQYELNLMGLYDREEHIIALQEDGKYMIEVPETWRENRPDEDD